MELELTAVYKYDVFGNRVEKDVTYASQTTQLEIKLKATGPWATISVWPDPPIKGK